MKKSFERMLPVLFICFRLFRDAFNQRRLRFIECNEGFYFVGDAALETSRYQSDELKVFKDCLGSVALVVDIGANAGFFSLLAAKNSIKSIAIEPNRLNFELLLKNIQKNNFFSITPLFMAASSHRTVAPMYGGGQGSSLLRSWGGMIATYSRLVFCTTLDELLIGTDSDTRILVKIDVEGAEHLVLSGALATLARRPSPTWIVEHGFRENFDGQINPNFKMVFEYFWSEGYTASTIEENPRIVSAEDVDSWIATGTRTFGWMYYKFLRSDA